MIFHILEKMSEITLGDKDKIMKKCMDALKEVTWRNNMSFAADTTIEQALQSARMNMDAGLQGALGLVPSTSDFHEWMDFVHLITVYYNVGKTAKKFTILRIGWFTLFAAYIVAFDAFITNVLNCFIFLLPFLLRVTVLKLGP